MGDNNTPPEAVKHPKRTRDGLTPVRGYFKVFRYDVARIRELGETDGCEVSIPVLCAVWMALCDIANEQASTTFTAGIGIIRYRAGVSRRTAFSALAVLEDHLKMVSHTQNTTKQGQSAKVYEASTWTIYPSGDTTTRKKKPSENAALGKSRTSANEVPPKLHKGLKKEEIKESPRVKRGSDSFISSAGGKKRAVTNPPARLNAASDLSPSLSSKKENSMHSASHPEKDERVEQPKQPAQPALFKCVRCGKPKASKQNGWCSPCAKWARATEPL